MNRTKSLVKLLLVGIVFVGPSIDAVSQGLTQSANTSQFMSIITNDPIVNSSDSIEQKPTPPSKSNVLVSRVVVEGKYAFNEALKYHPLKSDYMGTPLKNGRYHNPDYPFLLSFKDVRKWKKTNQSVSRI